MKKKVCEVVILPFRTFYFIKTSFLLLFAWAFFVKYMENKGHILYAELSLSSFIHETRGFNLFTEKALFCAFGEEMAFNSKFFK